ncbi:hypothetical protein TIFTF001_026257 [Ficus carica]|uniref:Uncharacterized protein n=1 Tax=Ficus carica TaxID=3494 RepID=A0AA88DKW3_FICCA|nr:hypothetical protein TIFTF001_026257 [Ficus carica]
MVSGTVLVSSKWWVGAVLELSVESWSPFVVLRSGCVCCEGLWLPRELGGGEGVGSVRGPALLVVGGVCPSCTAGFPSLLLAFFPRWAEDSPPVSRIGFCVNWVLAVVWLGVIWWADLAFTSPVVGVFLRVWDRGSLWLSPSELITCVLSRGLWTLGLFGGSLAVRWFAC